LFTVTWLHWHRLVKNIGWANQNIGGQKVVKGDKCMGVSQLLGGVPGLPPKVYAYAWLLISVPAISITTIIENPTVSHERWLIITNY